MTNRSLRVLLIDGQTGDCHWIQELLADFEQGRFAAGWMHGIELFHLERLSDATTLLQDAREGSLFDAVLLNPALPDSSGLHSYLRLRAYAPHIPVVILAEQDDPDLAISMIRAGAQDFLAKSTLDCEPLAHALRLAVERTRIVSDLRSLSWRDEVSGLYNRSGFDLLAAHDLEIARRHGHLLAIASIEIGGLAETGRLYGREEQHLAMSEVADALRSVIDPPASLARIDEQTFAVSFLVADESEVALLLTAIHRRFQRLIAPKANRSRLHLRAGVAFRMRGGDRTVPELLAEARRDATPLSACRPSANVAAASLLGAGRPSLARHTAALEAVGLLCENDVGENHHADRLALCARRDLQPG
jgi:PleD family two-component response regulator